MIVMCEMLDEQLMWCNSMINDPKTEVQMAISLGSSVSIRVSQLDDIWVS